MSGYPINSFLIIFKTILFFGMICFFTGALGQDSLSVRLRQELIIAVDNDALLFGKNDNYYSSGLFIRYRRLMNENKRVFKIFDKKDRLSKAIVSYDFVHKMYTAKDIGESEASKIDRPYAGWLNGNFALNYHFKNNSTLVFEYNLGLLGPGTRTDDIQIWWHDFFNMKTPRGWQYQINNTLATNLSIMYQKRVLKAGKYLDFITEQFAQVGTINNNLRSGLTMRWGQFGDLDNTIYNYSKLGQVKKNVRDLPENKRVQEFYFFLNATIEHVFYNSTIEGSFIGAPSLFTKNIEPWVFHHTWGLGRSGRLFDWRIAVFFRSTEVKEAGKHKYVAIMMAQRF